MTNNLLDIADQLDAKADALLAKKDKDTPEDRISGLLSKMEYYIKEYARRTQAGDQQMSAFHEKADEIIQTRNVFFYFLCFLVVLITLAFGAIAYLQNTQLKTLANEIRLQPVARVDTGESKEAFAKIGDQVTAAAGNTIMAVNKNTDDKLKAIQEEMKAQLDAILAKQQPVEKIVVKKVYIKPKQHRRKLALQNSALSKSIPDDMKPDYIEPYDHEKAKIDVDKASGRAVLK